MTKRIDAILARVKERGVFPVIQRYTYDKMNIEDEMAIIRAIGKTRTPNFVIDDHNRAAFENIVKWCFGDSSAMALNPETHQPEPANMKAGWWIAGNTGSGKSWCLDIIKEYCAVLQFRVDFGEKQGCLVWRNHRADEIVADYQATGEMEVRKQHVIGIHDVGTEQMETLYMGNRIPVIRTILEYRGDRSDMITFVTSNLAIGSKKLGEYYGDRVESRLREMFNYIEIRGIDRRKK